jgi:hypothetical protein
LREPGDGFVELGFAFDQLGLHLRITCFSRRELTSRGAEVLLGGIELALGLLKCRHRAGELLAGLIERLLGVTELAVDAPSLSLEVVLLVGSRRAGCSRGGHREHDDAGQEGLARAGDHDLDLGEVLTQARGCRRM